MKYFRELFENFSKNIDARIESSLEVLTLIFSCFREMKKEKKKIGQKKEKKETYRWIDGWGFVDCDDDICDHCALKVKEEMKKTEKLCAIGQPIDKHAMMRKKKRKRTKGRKRTNEKPKRRMLERVNCVNTSWLNQTVITNRSSTTMDSWGASNLDGAYEANVRKEIARWMAKEIIQIIARMQDD